MICKTLKMGITELFWKLSDSEYTAKFQNLCGIYHCYEEELIDSEERKNNIDFHQRKTCVNNNTIETNRKQSIRTPKSEVDRIWIYLTWFQKVLFYVLTFASSLGNEVFYLLFYPYFAWNVDSVVVRRTSVVWCLCMYTGQALKDYLRWPRPSSPPVVKLEVDFLQEFGMPSTHAMSATAIPFMLAYTIITRYEISPILVLTVAVCWCLLVCLSRLYLGVHSVLDIICGVAISLVIVFITAPHLKEYDLFQQSHPVAPLVVLGFGVALCTVCYPKRDKVTNTTKGDAVQIVAVSAGVTLGTWINYQYGFTVDKGQVFQAQMVFPTVTMVAESFLRMVIGVLILGFLRSLIKTPSIKFFSYVFNLDKPNKNHPSVETAYKFVTYYVLGFGITFLVPYTHFLLGLGRSAYFNEVQ